MEARTINAKQTYLFRNALTSIASLQLAFQCVSRTLFESITKTRLRLIKSVVQSFFADFASFERLVSLAP